MGLVLRFLHAVSALLMIGNVFLGYAAAYGAVGLERHIPYGFLSALVIAFTHAMTLFYFLGIGSSLREATAGRADLIPLVRQGAASRRHLPLLIGLALVTLMAAVILGGGSHTQRLPYWVHHSAAVAALIFNLIANVVSVRALHGCRTLIDTIERRLSGEV